MSVKQSWDGLGHNDLPMISHELPEEKFFQLLNVTEQHISKFYKLGEVIGEGRYCQVRKAYFVHDQDITVAVKIIKVKNIK